LKIQIVRSVSDVETQTMFLVVEVKHAFPVSERLTPSEPIYPHVCDILDVEQQEAHQWSVFYSSLIGSDRTCL